MGPGRADDIHSALLQSRYACGRGDGRDLELDPEALRDLRDDVIIERDVIASLVDKAEVGDLLRDAGPDDAALFDRLKRRFVLRERRACREQDRGDASQ